MGEILKRGRGYSLRYYEGGTRKVLASKQTSYADAKRMLAEIEARIARGEAGLVPRKNFGTLGDLIERFLVEYRRPRIKDLARYRAQARSVLQRATPLASCPVATISSSDIVKWRDALASRRLPGTVYNAMNQLAAVFAWGVRHGLAPHNPLKGVERPTTSASLDFFSTEESQRLLKLASERAISPAGRMLHLAVAIALHTGLRKGEIFGLRWIDIDCQTRRLSVARSFQSTPKSGKTRHLRLPSLLIPLLTAWQTQCPLSPQGLVLPFGRGDDRLCKKDAHLGLPRLLADANLRPVLHPWHTLRHTFASHYIMRGGNLLTLSNVLGHADVKVTMIYAHLAPDFLADEMDRVRFL